MSNAIVYYGAPTKAGQAVSEELRSRGINLLRSSPSSSYPEVIREITSLQYENYINNLGAAFKAALENRYVYLRNSSFYYVPDHKLNPIYMRIPVTVWNYSTKQTPDALARIRERFDAIETVAQGKPAFQAPLSIARMKDLVDDTLPNDTTPASTTSINIAAYRIYVRLHRIADMVFRLHQYPLTYGSSTESSYFKEALQVETKNIEKSLVTYDVGKPTEFKVYNFGDVSKIRLNMNLIERDLSKVSYTISSASSNTAECSLIFPFLLQLAKEDNSMIEDTIARYLMPILGDSADVALEVFAQIKSGWGVLKNTLWGHELAHIFSAVRLMFDTGAMVRVIVTPNNIYQGFVLIGAGYKIRSHGVTFTPVSQATFREAFQKSSPHLQALITIADLIQFDDGMARQGFKDEAVSMFQVAAALRKWGYDANKDTQILQAASSLTFPKDNSLPMTAINVARVLQAMCGRENEEYFPLHPVAVLERDHKKRLLSAFGAMVPSFLIPGGRNVSLEGAFEYNVVAKGKKEARSTTKMFCMAVPYAKGCADLDQVIMTKLVQSPIGTPLAGRASSFSVIREFAGNGGVEVLGALRQVCGVAMETGSGEASSSRKRRNEEPEDDGPVKKKAAFADF